MSKDKKKKKHKVKDKSKTKRVTGLTPQEAAAALRLRGVWAI